jgi:ATP-dependent helicase/nuclease subunit A
MNQPVDARQRQQALDCSQSFIVQAPAGSGKTELLTQRYLKLLCRVDRPERILAITFTRKATREMRARIEKRLNQAFRGEPAESAHEQQAVDLARQALEHDAAMGWNLMRNPSRMRIQTIDGLCSQYLARDPGSAGVGAGMAVQEDAGPLYLEAVERLFDHLGSVPDEGDDWSPARVALTDVLVHLDGNALALQDLLVRKLASRDQWVKRLGMDTATLAEVLQHRQEFELAEFTHALGWPQYQAAMALVRALGETVSRPDHPAVLFGKVGANPGSAVEAGILQAWYFSRVFLTSSGLRSANFNKSAFPDMAEGLRPQLDELKEIYGEWMANPAAQSALLRMAKSPPLDLDVDARGSQESVVTVLQYALAELRVLFAERATCDFHYVTEQALESLGSESDPGPLLLAEDLRLEHILMDEFQDTSNTQFEIIRRLVSGWNGSTTGQADRTLFLVGDPMQSIYRFREANVGLFIDVVEQGNLGEVPLEYLRLQANFRSGAAVVDWVNHHFQEIFPATDQGDAGAVCYAPADAAAGPGGGVEIHPFAPEASDRDEAEHVVQLIGQARAQLPDPSIAVLARSRKHFADIAALLQERGMEYEAVKVSELQSRPVIQDLLSITRALLHPLDRPAWLGLLRAPWCALTVTELHTLAGDDPNADVLQRMRQAHWPATSECARRVAHLQLVMQQTMENRSNRSLRDRVETAWLQLGGPRCYASPAESENSAVFFRLLSELEEAGNERLVERLNSRIEKLYASSKSSKLQLMVIHQAKGLEFDVVIMPGLQRTTRTTDPNLVELQEFRLDDGRNAALMAPIPSRQKPEASLYAYLQAVDAERSGYETQRLLYVACTRARQQLHLLGRYRETQKDGLKAPGGSLMELLSLAFESAGQSSAPLLASTATAGLARDPSATDNSDEDEEPLTPSSFPLLKLHIDALPTLENVSAETPEPAQWRPLPNRSAAALGQAVHDWLELMHDHWDRGWNARWFADHPAVLESSLLQAGASQAALPDLLKQLQDILSSILQSEAGQGIISPQGKSGSWAELPLLRRDGNRISRHIIDRLYEDENGLTIIDYKTGADSTQTREQWASQLQRYRELVQSLEAGKISSTVIFQVNDNHVIDLTRES